MRDPVRSISSLPARVRLLAACRPARRHALRRSAAALLAAAVVIRAHVDTDRAAALRERWEATVAVVVAIHDLPAGALVGRADVRVEKRPATTVPDGALGAVPPHPVRLAVGVPAGEALLRSRLGRSGAAAAMAPGQAALQVSPTARPPSLAPGDHVDLLAAPGQPAPDTGSGGDGSVPDGSGAGAPTGEDPSSSPTTTFPVALVVARDAVVLAVAPAADGSPDPLASPSGSVTVAVADDDLAAAAAAVLAGPVTLALRPAR